LDSSKVIAVIPVYNEEDLLAAVFDEVSKYVDMMIVVEDGSQDCSLTMVRKWMAGRKEVYLLQHSRNRGMAHALKTGFLFASRLMTDGRIKGEDIIVNIDADGQHPVEQIPAAVKRVVEDDLDVLLVCRDFSCYPRYKVWGNRFLTFLARMVSGFPYRDVESGFRLVRARSIPLILDYYTGWKYSCAQEIAIITALHPLRIRNDFQVRINYYRPGTTVMDGFAVLVMSFVAYLRIKSGRRNSPEALAGGLDGVIIEHSGEA
jgi:glycosyltransferase involved in cell wall biosynthesis